MNFKASISSTACVLPGLGNQVNGEISENILDSSSYVVIPPMSEWHKIRWGKDLDKEIQTNFTESKIGHGTNANIDIASDNASDFQYNGETAI